MSNIAEMKKQIQTGPFVNGARVKPSSGETYGSYDPSSNERTAEIPMCGAEEMNQAIVAARKAFDEGPWGRLGVKKRLGLLERFATLIESKAEFLGTIESLDVGKLLRECIGHDVARASGNIRFFARAMQSQTDEAFFSDGKFLDRELRTMSVTKREPVGVAGLIVPWNSPIMLATWKIGPCLASGNTCVIKPSPWASLSILQLGEIAKEAGIPDGVINIVPGGAEAGDALVRNPLVDRVSFTGSVPVGHAINRANAETRLAPVSLELGGKSPAVVFENADIDFAVKGVARGIFRSQGQSCVAGSRLLLQDSIYDSFMEKLITTARGMSEKMGNQLDSASELGPLITKEHFENVERHILKGIDEGAKLSLGGKRSEKPEHAAGNFVEPTIFEELLDEMAIWKEEVFGPVLAVRRFKDEAEAIALANDSEFGLSSSIWTTNYEQALRVANGIQAGMVWVNSHFVRDLRAPFGGVKESGIGSEGGRYSLEFYSKPKMICLPYAV